jgi:hypothetical protein
MQMLCAAKLGLYGGGEWAAKHNANVLLPGICQATLFQLTELTLSSTTMEN